MLCTIRFSDTIKTLNCDLVCLILQCTYLSIRWQARHVFWGANSAL